MIGRLPVAAACVAVIACAPPPQPLPYAIEVDLPGLHQCDSRAFHLVQPSRPADCAAPTCVWYDLLIASEPNADGGLDVYATAIAAWDIPLPPPPSIDQPYESTSEGHIILPRTKISKNVVSSDLEQTLRSSVSAAEPADLRIDQKCVMLDPSQRLTFGDVVRMHKALTRLGVRLTNLAAREAIE